jgi:hypothetical protein
MAKPNFEIKPGQIEFYIKEIIKNKIILTQVLRETLWDTIKNGQVIEVVLKMLNNLEHWLS